MKFPKILKLISLSVLSGCATYSTLQSASTLAPGKFQIAPGISTPLSSETREFTPEVGIRYGVFSGFDLGTKIVGYNTFFADGKVQLLKSKVDIAFDLGGSYSSFEDKDLGIHVQNTSIYPMLLVGQRHWYAGAKGVYSIIDGKVKTLSNSYTTGSDWTSTNFVLGGVFGERKGRILPELNVIISNDGDVWFVPAIGIQIGIN